MGYKQGYSDNEDRFKNAKCIDGDGFVEGYVDGGERPIQPFIPVNITVEEIVVTPPPVTGGGSLFIQYVQTVNQTASDGDILTPETFSFAPLTSDLYITINGLIMYPANGAGELSVSALYITDPTGTIIRPKGTYQINDVFRWQGSTIGWQIEADDEIKIIYEI